jgi:arsenate reductase (thioredoxin)
LDAPSRRRLGRSVLGRVGFSQEIPRPWTEEIISAADIVITMGCGDTCPVFPGKRYLDWEVEDPSNKTISEVRQIRDDLERRVRALLAEPEVSADE